MSWARLARMLVSALEWLVTGVFYGPGWVTGRIWFCIIKAVKWAGSSIAEGFTAGAHPPE